LTASLLVDDTSLLWLVRQPLLDQDVLWLSWQVGELLNDDTTWRRWDRARVDLDGLRWNAWWRLWWSLAVDQWSWVCSSAALLTDDHRGSGGHLRLALADDQIAWLRWLRRVEVSDGDLLRVLEAVELLADDLWVRVIVDGVLLERDRATELGSLGLVQVDAAELAGRDLLALVRLDRLACVHHLLLNLALLVATSRLGA